MLSFHVSTGNGSQGLCPEELEEGSIMLKATDFKLLSVQAALFFLILNHFLNLDFLQMFLGNFLHVMMGLFKHFLWQDDVPSGDSKSYFTKS